MIRTLKLATMAVVTGALKLDDTTEADSKGNLLAQAQVEATCPPTNWSTCGDQWPPKADGYCCGESGWLGTSTTHCDYSNALTDCCKLIDAGIWCTIPDTLCVDPIDDCTGDAKTDAILKSTNLGCVVGLTTANSLYTMKGFCDALQQYNSIDNVDKFYVGNGTDAGAALGMTNIAAFLAQTMWESGGADPFTGCDENNSTGYYNASCTQKENGDLYSSLNVTANTCTWNQNDMTMTAETYNDNGPMKCTPGDENTEYCCWWGRGAIQTTGPDNYGALQTEVISKLTTEYPSMDICKNPEEICQNENLIWIGSIFFWAQSVQGADAPLKKTVFDNSMDAFLLSNYTRSSSEIDDYDFAQGTGNLVNYGDWTIEAHESDKRVSYFDSIMGVIKSSLKDFSTKTE